MMQDLTKVTLEEIAMDASYALAERGDLDTRNNDDEDFISIPVWAIRRMLEGAYEKGLQEAYAEIFEG